jgi:hypothetical protein
LQYLTTPRKCTFQISAFWRDFSLCEGNFKDVSTLWQDCWRDFIMPVNKVRLTYVDQNIPSPFGMPAFELNPIPASLIVGSHDTIHDALRAYEASIESAVPPAAVDFSG